jgi:hypothetical protein
MRFLRLLQLIVAAIGATTLWQIVSKRSHTKSRRKGRVEQPIAEGMPTAIRHHVATVPERSHALQLSSAGTEQTEITAATDDGAVELEYSISAADAELLPPISENGGFPVESQMPDQMHRPGSIDPIHRGGRPGQTAGSDGVSTRVGSMKLRHEIVCLKRGRAWFVAIEVKGNRTGVELTQDGSILPERNSGVYEVAVPEVPISLWIDGYVHRTIEVFSRGIAIFRLATEAAERGRLVKSIGTGSYAVLARDDVEISNPNRSPLPEPSLLPGFTMHFVTVGEDSQPVEFVTAFGEVTEFRPGEDRFTLVGEQIKDANSGVGPLFVGEPPKVVDVSNRPWENIEEIIVGEEGEDRTSWRKRIPVQGDAEPASLSLRRPSGSFFARIYDRDQNLVQSLHFRYCQGLRAIEVPVAPRPPYQEVVVLFQHSGSCHIEPKIGADRLEIEKRVEDVIVRVPAEPAWDFTEWAVKERDGNTVEIAVLLERIWWGVGDASSEIDMAARSVKFEDYDFWAISDRFLRVWLPAPGWVSTVEAGFEGSLLRRFPVPATERRADIPLREYCDSAALLPQAGARNCEFVVRIPERTGDDPIQLGWVQVPASPRQEEASDARNDVVLRTTRRKTRGESSAFVQGRRPGSACENCDYARTVRGTYRCVRHHWFMDGPVDGKTFEENFSSYWCSEWRGEVRGPDGEWR